MQRSDVVVIFFTQSYLTSRNCRRELVEAWRNHEKPRLEQQKIRQSAGLQRALTGMVSVAEVRPRPPRPRPPRLPRPPRRAAPHHARAPRPATHAPRAPPPPPRLTVAL